MNNGKFSFCLVYVVYALDAIASEDEGIKDV